MDSLFISFLKQAFDEHVITRAKYVFDDQAKADNFVALVKEKAEKEKEKVDIATGSTISSKVIKTPILNEKGQALVKLWVESAEAEHGPLDEKELLKLPQFKSIETKEVSETRYQVFLEHSMHFDADSLYAKVK